MLSLGLDFLDKSRRSSKGGTRLIFGVDGSTVNIENRSGCIWQDAADDDDPSMDGPKMVSISESERTASSSFSGSEGSPTSSGGPKRLCKYCPGNAWVNLERCSITGCKPLQRSLALDEVARWHAQAMADALHVNHSDPEALCLKLKDSSTNTPNILGENVGKGTTVKGIHATMVQNRNDFANMVDHRYTEMGMATARSIDSRGRESIYLCQLFRG